MPDVEVITAATTEALEPQVAHQTLAIDDATRARYRAIIEEGTAPNTIRARRQALGYFWTWAEVAHQALECSYPVPPALVVQFIVAHLQGLDEAVDLEMVRRGVKAKAGPHSVATVESRVAHLSAMHRIQGLDSPAAAPEVRELLKAARRRRAAGGGQAAKVAIGLQDLGALVATTRDDRPLGVRDRALLLLAWGSGGRRRSEVAAARWEHIRPVEDSFVMTIPRSKADQEGQGLEVPVTGRAAQALREWRATLEDAGIDTKSGPVFRRISKGGRVLTTGPEGISCRTVARIVKRRAEAAGIDPARVGGHSLRAGFVTAGGDQGIALPELMALTGHKSVQVAARYHRGGASLHNRAAHLVG